MPNNPVSLEPTRLIHSQQTTRRGRSGHYGDIPGTTSHVIRTVSVLIFSAVKNTRMFRLELRHCNCRSAPGMCALRQSVAMSNVFFECTEVATYDLCPPVRDGRLPQLRSQHHCSVAVVCRMVPLLRALGLDEQTPPPCRGTRKRDSSNFDYAQCT